MDFAKALISQQGLETIIHHRSYLHRHYLIKVVQELEFAFISLA